MSRRLNDLSNPIYAKGRFEGIDVGQTNATRAYLNVIDYYRQLAVENKDIDGATLLDEIREKFSEKYNNLRAHNISQLRLSTQMMKDAKEERKQERLKEKANATNN